MTRFLAYTLAVLAAATIVTGFVDDPQPEATPVVRHILIDREAAAARSDRADRAPVPIDKPESVTTPEPPPPPPPPEPDPAPVYAAPVEESSGGLPWPWNELAACESGGNPQSVNPAGYYGLFQFTLSTWASVGGTGNPIDASSDEQLLRARILQARSGWWPWPVCGAPFRGVTP